jgi:hypothetical protein
MQRFTYWLVLALVLATPAQTIQAKSNSAGLAAQPVAGSGQLIQMSTGSQPSAVLLSASAQVTDTVGPQPAIRSPLAPLTRTTSITPVTVITAPITAATPPTQTVAVTPTTPATTTTVAPTPLITGTAPVDDTGNPLQGTIIANRTEATVRFFVEGQTYELAPLRSQGLGLPRETGVLNLFNCDARTPETQEGCFWDPYLLDRDGFYEVVSGEAAGKAVSLVLQEAGAPPVNQIWVQNRSNTQEIIFHSDRQYELPPASVQEFTGQPGVPVTLYLRSCLELTDRTVCEWYPQSVDTGVYYALTEIATTGAVPGSRIQMLELQPIVSSSQVGPVAETPTQLVCTLVVPALNVRSGPGLEYEIVSKVRGTEAEPGTVLVVGRDEAGQWLAVDERVANGGWITGSGDFVNCGGDVNTLPIAAITDGTLAATPTPQVANAPVTAAPAAEQPEAEAAPAPVPNTPTTPITTTIPDGQALLIVNNGFDQVVRFTLDQRFRVEHGTSEFDLQPGQSMSFFVYPGMVAFSVSTPWRGLSDNADFFIDNKQSRTLWLIFVPDPDGSGNWILQY